jgi:hypothetical protein
LYGGADSTPPQYIKSLLASKLMVDLSFSAVQTSNLFIWNTFMIDCSTILYTSCNLVLHGEAVYGTDMKQVLSFIHFSDELLFDMLKFLFC